MSTEGADNPKQGPSWQEEVEPPVGKTGATGAMIEAAGAEQLVRELSERGNQMGDRLQKALTQAGISD